MAISTFAQDRFKYTTIAHNGHHYCSPLSPNRAAELLAALQLQPDALVLDAGCGKAALLRDLLKSQPVRGVGVDINSYFLAEASDAWVASNPDDDRLTLIESEVKHHPFPASGYDAILCIGSTHAFDGFEHCLTICKQWLKPGGKLLVGEAYWKQRPSDEYLAILDAREDELTGHAENAKRTVAHGYTLRTMAASNDDEWDQYERMYCAAIMQYIAAHPEDPDAQAFGDRAQRWYDSYLASGRSTLGFGYYLLQKN
ncbi:SAM-dependent methyltransferase [Collimonas arenae]|uniref:SAM-dependent methyltransferase n=1 Tax=Collimonas arenae TaxID=279058 RepID=A0A0A1FB95_9BURK|nr:class I SAM-dependent methyltransferase [Collimonas arenae]AIY42028.1 SAM-dependent methyltransferase [Collimonas arenae]